MTFRKINVGENLCDHGNRDLLDRTNHKVISGYNGLKSNK